MSREPGPSRASRLWVSSGVALAVVVVPMRWLPAQPPETVITGVIEDGVTGQPVALATLSLNGAVATLTDGVGRFRIEAVEPGTNVLQVRRIGYGPVEIDVWVDPTDAALELAITLAPAPTELEPIAVEGDRMPLNRKLIAFEERRKMGFGHFVTTEQIEAWNPSEVTDVLQKAPGVIVRPNPFYGYIHPGSGEPDFRRYVIESSRRLAGFGSESCSPHFYVDGVYRGTQGPEDLPLDSFLSIGALAAVEVYSGPSQIPAEFNRFGAACGVVVMWTR